VGEAEGLLLSWLLLSWLLAVLVLPGPLAGGAGELPHAAASMTVAAAARAAIR
jgi:hypothetical protein